MDAAPIDVYASATVMLDVLNNWRVSAVELLDLHMRRIERYNPVLNFECMADRPTSVDQKRSLR